MQVKSEGEKLKPSEARARMPARVRARGGCTSCRQGRSERRGKT